MTAQASRPRILMLATRVPLQSGDGTPSFVLDNAVAMAGEFDITIIAPRVPDSDRVTTLDGVTVRRFAYFPRRWESLANDAIMPRLTKQPTLWLQAGALVICMLAQTLMQHARHRPGAVHAQWILPSGLIAYLVNRLVGTPYLVTSHGADAFRLNSRPLRRVKRAIVTRSSRFIAVSREIAHEIAAGQVPVEVQPTGSDFDLWRRLVGERTPQAGRILFVGRLDAKKGVADAIRAVAGLDDVQLRIVGDGPLRQDLETLAATLGSAEGCVFLGRSTREQIAEEMRTAACVVIPSVNAPDGDRDGTPNVLGEAIAAGVPVVASRIAGIVDYVEHQKTGLLHVPGDVTDLRDCVRSVVHSPELGQRLADNAQEQFKSALDVRVVATRYANWYREAIADTAVSDAD